MLRHYVSQIVGDGSSTNNPFRSVIEDLILGVQLQAVDGRSDATLGSGWMLASCNVSDADHALLIADPRVIGLPLEDANGAALLLDAPLSNIPLSKLQQLINRCEAHHVPVQDIGLANTVKDVLRRIIKRCLLRQMLRELDYIEALDTLVSALPAQRRNRTRDRLIANGFDPSVIVGSDTIREALRKLLLQLPERTHLD